MHIAFLSHLATSSHSSSLLCIAHEDIDLLLVAAEAPVVLLHSNQDAPFAHLLSHARFVLVRIFHPELLPLVPVEIRTMIWLNRSLFFLPTPAYPLAHHINVIGIRRFRAQ